jgi:hypothetical protein
MVVHEAVSEDSEFLSLHIVFKDFQIIAFILVRKEDALPPVPSLSQVMGDPWYDQTSQAGHLAFVLHLSRRSRAAWNLIALGNWNSVIRGRNPLNEGENGRKPGLLRIPAVWEVEG